MKETIVEVKDVSIKFNMSFEKYDSFKEYIIKMIKQQITYHSFWALKNVNFEVKKGDTLGLIGLNGSGKSTILKIIAGILRPTQGTVKVKGKIAPLIELGAGFDGDLTGEENVYLNGALLGYSQSEIKKNYRDIVEFSELENFMNVPVKNYSSGMLSRLAFAIATIGIPDILIVDEVLSVGDFRFQKKCEDRIKKMQESGTTVLFVSHSIEQVKKICNKIVWLDHGKVRMYGNTREVCEEYEKI
ncbi:Teichoic acids export ATP-binding protein TagH [Dorea longicatena]|uniref:Teichoic acids export ATP-binding protein TagH n=1 Tax=Dorea longicatena TaxID=88431 RepID=A0A564T7S2_9FIRM|nr:ABC transporter ATP-binding protein [Dorea longicatena]VUX03132.1 Teichoic acids export ATP-binding protein TagH [Dorea longicatena]